MRLPDGHAAQRAPGMRLIGHAPGGHTFDTMDQSIGDDSAADLAKAHPASIAVFPAAVAARSLPAREGRRPLDADGTDERVRVPMDQLPHGSASAVDLGHAQ